MNEKANDLATALAKLRTVRALLVEHKVDVNWTFYRDLDAVTQTCEELYNEEKDKKR